jgi:hypothetical protein
VVQILHFEELPSHIDVWVARRFVELAPKNFLPLILEKDVGDV